MGTPLKVLIIQPPQTDAGPVQRQLWHSGFEPDCVLAESLPALQTVLANTHWDIVLCHQGLSFLPQALTTLKAAGLDPPFILIADSVIPMEQVTTLMEAGGHAIVYSDNLANLAPVVERELRQAQARRQTREAVLQSEHRYRLIFDTVPVSIWEGDLAAVKAALDELKIKGVSDFRRYLKGNPAFIRRAAGQIKVLNVNATTLLLYGARDKEELQKALDQVLVSQTYALFRDLLIAIAEGETFFKGETICRTLKGKLLHVIVSLVIPVETAGFKNIAICVVDITAHRHTEEALARSQQNFQNVVVKNQSGIVITDHQGTVLFSNPTAQLLLGRSEQG